MSVYSRREPIPREFRSYNDASANLYFGIGMSYQHQPVWPTLGLGDGYPTDDLWYNEFLSMLKDSENG